MTKVLIFDYDGVIVDSLSVFMKYFMKSCKNNGIEIIKTKDDFLSLFNGNMFDQMMKRGMNKEIILNIVFALKKDLIAHQHEIPLFPGIKSSIKQLADHHTLVISTSNETNVVSSYLKEKNIFSVFDNIYGSDIEPSKVKKIKMIKQKYPSKNYTYIGDTIGDIKEAKQANIHTVAVTWGWHTKKQLRNTLPGLLIYHPEELISLL